LGSNLTRIVRQTRRSFILRTVAAVALRWSWKWLLALLLIITLDASLDWPALLRLGLSLSLIMSILVFLFAELRCLIRSRKPNPARFARAVEKTLGMKGNPLTNAVFFKTRPACAVAGEIPLTIQPPPPSPLTTILTQRAIAEAERIASNTSPTTTIHRAAQNEVNRLQILPNVIVLLILSLSLIIAPRLFAFGLPRLIDPLGDHPPFTWFNFDIQISPGPDEVYVADDVRIQVVITGRGAEQLKSVQLERLKDNRTRFDCSPTGLERIPMQPLANFSADEDKSVPPQSNWGFRLRDIRQDAAFRIHAGNARSKRFNMSVIQRPRILSSRVTLRTPDYAGAGEYPIADRSEPISVVLGGSVRVQLRSSLPIGRVVADSVADHPPSSFSASVPPDRPESAEVAIPVNELGPHAVRFRVADESGRKSIDAIILTIVGIADQPPTVEITSPACNAAALSTSVIPIEVLARDDLGISTGTLHVEIKRALNAENEASQDQNNAPSLPIPFKRQSQNALQTSEYAIAPSAWNAAMALDLYLYDLKPGDVIRYSAHIMDNCSEHFGGAQSAKSEIYEIIIIDEATLDLLTDSNTNAGSQTEQSQSTTQSESARFNATRSPTSAVRKAGETKSDENSDIQPNRKSNALNRENAAGSSSNGTGSRSGAADQSGNNRDTSADSSDDARDNQSGETAGDSQNAGTNSSNVEQPAADTIQSDTIVKTRSAADDQAEQAEPAATTSQPDKDNLRKQLQEQLKDRIIFGRPVQPIRNEGIGSTNPDALREKHEAMVYEFAEPNSASRTSTTRKSGKENRQKPESMIIHMPSSASLRSIPLQYRDLAVEYFRKVALAESNNEPRAALKRKK